MIIRESARTEPKPTPTSCRPSPRESRGAATALERVVFLNLGQGTNFSRAEQIGGGGGTNAGRVQRNANLSAVRLKFESKCQNQP